MKKLLTMMLILALSVSCLAGCGSSKPANTETLVNLFLVDAKVVE